MVGLAAEPVRRRYTGLLCRGRFQVIFWTWPFLPLMASISLTRLLLLFEVDAQVAS